VDIYEQRQIIKKEDVAYREAARRLTAHLGGTVSDYNEVTRPANNDGAFIYVSIWVPRAEIEPKPAPDPDQVVCPRCKSADRLRAFPGGKYECVECDFVF
jgi:hypothetical protein